MTAFLLDSLGRYLMEFKTTINLNHTISSIVGGVIKLEFGVKKKKKKGKNRGRDFIE